MSRDEMKMRLAEDNSNLLDVFSEHPYLEIGTIGYHAYQKLFAMKTVKIEEIIDFPIQNRGIGASNLSSSLLRNELPYIFFDKLMRYGSYYQLFLTYGLIAYEIDQKECFAPLILLPIQLFYENELFYISLFSNPVENSVFLNELKRQKIEYPSVDRIDNLFDIDRYAANFSKMTNLSMRLENYITIAKIQHTPIVINHDRFSLALEKQTNREKNYFLSKDRELVQILPASSQQQVALERAKRGNSFGIVGHLGTGKTATLINIASQAIAENKKVLYLSPIKDHLRDMERLWNNMGLGGLVSNLSETSNTILMKKKYQFRLEKSELNIEIIKKQLYYYYRAIEKYEAEMAGRIHNFRFIEVAKQVIIQKKPSSDLPLDSLQSIYKKEYDEIMASLCEIEKDLTLLPRMKESKFVNIPIINTIQYPNQILSLLYQLQQAFLSLQQFKKQLEEEHGFKEVINFARFKNVINAISSLDEKTVPAAWKKNNYLVFEEAKAKFDDLKKQIYLMQEQELYLEWQYQNFDSISIDDMIESLLDNHFTADDFDAINNMLSAHHDLLASIRVGNHNSRVFQQTLVKLKTIMDWDFNEKDDETLQDILRLNDLMKNNFLHNKWFHLENQKEIRSQILTLRDRIKRFNQLENRYFQYFSAKEEIDQNIIQLVKYQDKKIIPAKFKKIDLEELSQDVREYKKQLTSILKWKNAYYELTGTNYQLNENIIHDFDQCVAYLSSIHQEENLHQITRFLSTVKFETIPDFLHEFNTFSFSYKITNDIYEKMKRYFPKSHIRFHYLKIRYLEKLEGYLNRIYDINLAMMRIVKNSDPIVPFNRYIDLKQQLDKLDEIKKEIRTNDRYPVIYGHLFQGTATQITDIQRLIKNYDAYIDCFNGAIEVKASLQHYEQIMPIIQAANEVSKVLAEAFKVYSKYFKDGVGSYYEDFSSVINRLETLVQAKEELAVYLNLTKNIQILYHHKLFILSNYIINGEVADPICLFNHTYFHYLYDEFIRIHPEVEDTKAIETTLLEVMKLEEQMRRYYVELLRQNYSVHNSYIQLSRFSYQDFVEKAQKPFYLSTPRILNYHLDEQYFDLILIDDAHLLYADEYTKAIMAKQVIFAGEDEIHFSTTYSLISKMRSNAVMKLTKRWIVTPESLSNNIDLPMCPIYSQMKDNQGMEIVDKNEIDLIMELLQEKANAVINFFVPSLLRRRSILEKISEKLIHKKMNMSLVEQVLFNQIHFCDLIYGDHMDADYNIIQLSDYHSKQDYISSNAIAHLALCRCKLYVIDHEQRFNQNTTVTLYQSLKDMMKTRIVNLENKELFVVLKNHFQQLAVSIHPTHYDLSLVVTKNEFLSGLIIYANPDEPSLPLQYLYQEGFQFLNKSGFPVHFIFITDLIKHYDQIIQLVSEVHDRVEKTW